MTVVCDRYLRPALFAFVTARIQVARGRGRSSSHLHRQLPGVFMPLPSTFIKLYCWLKDGTSSPNRACSCTVVGRPQVVTNTADKTTTRNSVTAQLSITWSEDRD